MPAGFFFPPFPPLPVGAYSPGFEAKQKTTGFCVQQRKPQPFQTPIPHLENPPVGRIPQSVSLFARNQERGVSMHHTHKHPADIMKVFNSVCLHTKKELQ